MNAGRLAREYRTIRAMIGLWCTNRHGTKTALCLDCAELLAYAKERLDRCPFHERKPACGRCTIHCYKPAMRERVRGVMRYAGPKMLTRHPLLAILHAMDELKGERKANK